MDVEMPKGRSFQKGFELQIYEDDLDRLEQMEDSEGTVRQIGAFSEGIQNLTVRTRNNYSLIIVSTASDSKLNAFLSFTRAC